MREGDPGSLGTRKVAESRECRACTETRGHTPAKALEAGSWSRTDTHGCPRHARRYWARAGAANPPRIRAPPRGPAAQGATSDRAPCRLQIRSALSPPAGSGDPPLVPSAPARLRATAPRPEGPGPPRSACPEAAAPPPSSPRSRPPWGPEDPAPEPARAVRVEPRRRGLRTERPCQARWAPGPAGPESGRPASRIRGALEPRPTSSRGCCLCPARPSDSEQGLRWPKH